MNKTTNTNSTILGAIKASAAIATLMVGATTTSFASLADITSHYCIEDTHPILIESNYHPILIESNYHLQRHSKVHEELLNEKGHLEKLIMETVDQPLRSPPIEFSPENLLRLAQSYIASRSLWNRGPSCSPELDDALGALSKRYPVTFKGFGQGNLKKVKTFQSAVMDLKDKSEANILSTHFDCLIPLVHEFRDYMLSIQAPNEESVDLIEDLKFDIDYMLRTRRTGGNKPLVTPALFLDMHARLVASFGPPSEDEKALFWHAVKPSLLLALFENDAWKTPLKYLVEEDNFDNKGREIDVSIMTSAINFEANQKICEQIMGESIPEKAILPMLGVGKLGIPFLVKSNLERSYPAPLTLNPDGYHGIRDGDTTPVGHTMHDIVHKELDNDAKQLEKHILETVDKEFSRTPPRGPNGIWPDNLVPGVTYFLPQNFSPDHTRAYAPIATKRFLKINEFFKFVFEKLATEVLPQRGLKEFKRIMSGYFWFKHESKGAGFYDPASAGSRSDIYGMHGLEDVINVLMKNCIDDLADSDNSWESSYDPLETNPIDGVPQLKAEGYPTGELIALEAALGANIDGVPQLKAEDYPTGELIALEAALGANPEFPNGDSLRNIDVTYLPAPTVPYAPRVRFVDVDFDYADGSRETAKFSTLYHKITNIEDARKLLKWAGTDIPKIDLDAYPDFNQKRDATMAYIDEVQSALISHLNLFRDVCRFYALNERGGYDSLARVYFQDSWDSEEMWRQDFMDMPFGVYTI